MPVLSADIDNAFKIAYNIKGEERSFSEGAILVANSWADALIAGKHIAYWRAAVLATDWNLTYATVTKIGPGKQSDVVIPTPIAGGIGVKFATADQWTVPGRKANNPGTKLRVRFQTADRDHVTRGFRALPDQMVVAFKLYATVLDQPDLGTYTAAYNLTDASLPYNSYWPDVDTTPPADAASYVTWDAAFKKLLNVLYKTTQWGKIVPGVGGANGTLNNKAWASLVYRRLSEVAPSGPTVL